MNLQYLLCRAPIFPRDMTVIYSSINLLITNPTFSRVLKIFFIFFSHQKFFVKLFFSHITTVFTSYKVACRVQIWKKIFWQNSDKFGPRFTKNDIMYMYFLCIYKKTIILSLFKITTLNYTMYILTILTCTLNIYVTGLHKFNFNKHFFTIKDHNLNCKGTAENK